MEWDAPEDRRVLPRQSLLGGEVFVFDEHHARYRLCIKDISPRGMCGLTDAPLTIGQQIIVQLEEMFMPVAEVQWTKHARMGMSFLNPIDLPRLKRLCERHASGHAWSPAMRLARRAAGGGKKAVNGR